MYRRAPSLCLLAAGAARPAAGSAAAGAAALGGLLGATFSLRSARDAFLDALQVACLADQAGQLGNASTLHPDLGQDRVDQRCLHAIAQRGVDHLVGGIAARATAASAREPVDVQDADALDLLHRLDAF